MFNRRLGEVSLMSLASKRPDICLSIWRVLLNSFGVQSTGRLIVDVFSCFLCVSAPIDWVFKCPIEKKFVNPFGIQPTGHLINYQCLGSQKIDFVD